MGKVLVLLSVLLCGCAASNVSQRTVEDRLVGEGPQLLLTVTPERSLTPRNVHMRAEIVGLINWCPTRIVWTFGDGGGKEEDVVSCHERIWTQDRFYSYGSRWVTFRIFEGPVQQGAVAHQVETINPSNER